MIIVVVYTDEGNKNEMMFTFLFSVASQLTSAHKSPLSLKRPAAN
jgi:hypothetical protein